jgi:hypothetical protein
LCWWLLWRFPRWSLRWPPEQIRCD